MGGPVAIEAARLLKGRVIGIIGVDTFKSIGAPPPSKAQIDAILKPFEADFIGQTRALVTDHLFAKGDDPQLAQKIAYDMSLSPPRVAIPSMRAVLEYDFTAAAQGHLGTHRRHQLRSRRARERSAHPQGAAEVPRRYAAWRRAISS